MNAWAAGLRPVLLLVGIAAAVAAGVAVVLWSRGPNYSLLYANLATEDQAQITQSLDAAGIPYRLAAGSNAIEVPSERVSDARLKLAGQGLPEGDGEFALMTKDSGFGVSQLMENARYQHALEQELAHTIASLRPVDGARVHIAAPPDSAFVRDRRPSSASVFVQLKPGRSLSQEQVQAIVNLVASSVPNLQAEQVTVVDQQGQLLSAPQGTDEFAQREQHLQQVHRLEDDYVQRIEELLTPLVGAGHVRAQVVASIDTSVSEEAREQYTPNSQIVRSEQLSEQTSRDGSNASGGVPGALSNKPPAAGVAQPPPSASASSASSSSSGATAGAAGSTAASAAAGATAAGAQSKPGAAAPAQPPDNVSTQSTRNYEIDRTLDYTRQPAGRLKRLTVAVLIDDIREAGKDGKPTERAMSSQELAHVTQLVKDAVGFDASRGDSVNVVNSSFQSEAAPADTQLEEVPLWERPLFTELAKLGAGLIVLLVLSLAVLRPLVRGLITPARAALAAPAAAAEAALAAPTSKAVAPSASAAATAQPYEQQVSNARALVNQDPKRVAQVVRTWVAADE